MSRIWRQTISDELAELIDARRGPLSLQEYTTFVLAAACEGQALAQRVAELERQVADLEGRHLVRLERRSDRIRVEVHDEDSRPPVAAQPGPREVSGRGLRIVEVVALAWGHTSAPTGGKTVWADIALP